MLFKIQRDIAKQKFKTVLRFGYMSRDHIAQPENIHQH